MKGSRDVFLRFIKGVFIGTGFILPGVSGGALAAVFGLYERLITFIAHINRDFKQNLIFFLPVALGGCFGVFLVSYAVSFFLERYQAQILWFFAGGILGTIPSLWKQAGKKNRRGRHLIIMVLSMFLGLIVLRLGDSAFNGRMPLNFATWIIAGIIIGLGVLVPGLSPSNFLVYFNLYHPMVEGFKLLDPFVIFPIAIGGSLCLLLFSKVMEYLFSRYYTGLFHCILGVVVASTVMILPTGYNYSELAMLACMACSIGGIALGYWMCLLETKHRIQ